MAQVQMGTECSALTLPIYNRPKAAINCEKCVELEVQPQLIRDELRSMQLIIEILNKDHVQKDAIHKQIHHVEDKHRGDMSWTTISNKSKKHRPEDNMKQQGNKPIKLNGLVSTANRFVALETNSDMISNPCGSHRSRLGRSDHKEAVSNPAGEIHENTININRILLSNKFQWL
jgi:hypothetical protein